MLFLHRITLCYVFSSVVATLSAQSQSLIVAAGYAIPVPGFVAQGQVVTLFVQGLNVPDAKAASVPLPRTLSGSQRESH